MSFLATARWRRPDHLAARPPHPDPDCRVLGDFDRDGLGEESPGFLLHRPGWRRRWRQSQAVQDPRPAQELEVDGQEHGPHHLQEQHRHDLPTGPPHRLHGLPQHGPDGRRLLERLRGRRRRRHRLRPGRRSRQRQELRVRLRQQERDQRPPGLLLRLQAGQGRQADGPVLHEGGEWILRRRLRPSPAQQGLPGPGDAGRHPVLHPDLSGRRRSQGLWRGENVQAIALDRPLQRGRASSADRQIPFCRLRGRLPGRPLEPQGRLGLRLRASCRRRPEYL